jgi:molybdate transport system substrate-binding protein
MRRRLVLAFVISLLGCHKELPRKGPVPKHDVTIFAAASLREAFTELAHTLETTHEGSHVVLSFAGSQTLRAQIEQGAPADVFASADERHMSALVTAQRVGAPRVFANNELVVVVARAKAATLRTLADLPHAERIVVGAPEVPVGTYTTQMLDKEFRGGVEANIVSREPDVRQVLAKVSLGEADAGIVYRTDALTAGDKVAVLVIPPEYNVVASYPIAVTSRTKQGELARAFVDLVVSADGARVLKQRGFTPVGAKAAAP